MSTVVELLRSGVRHHLEGNLIQAEALYRQALQADPGSADAYHQLGLIAHQTGRNKSAVELIRHAIRLYPQAADYYSNLGIVYMQLNETADAVVCYREALRIDSGHVNALINLAEALKKRGEMPEARDRCEQALFLAPDNASARNALGGILFSMASYEEAACQFDEALRLAPGLTAAHSNRALLRLLTGDFKRGWQEYEYRRMLPTAGAARFVQPRWDGGALRGRTILVYAEQGLGDTIQFVRHFRELKELGGTVLLLCQPTLVSLMKRLPWIDGVLAADDTLPVFDFHVPLLSLPGLLHIRPANVHAPVPYLSADYGNAERWRSELETIAGFRIGISWQGNPSHEADVFRSVPLAYFEALADLAEVRLISLQVGEGRQQMDNARFPLVNLADRFNPSSLEDLAATLVNLDLVVTVDSAVAHLAGALGVRVWTLLPHVPDWRWGLDREDTPWYPTMRLFRQSTLGDWAGVFERLIPEVSASLEEGKIASKSRP